MSENVAAKLTSPSWLKAALSSRARDMVNSLTFRPHTIEREVVGEKHEFYIGNVTGQSWYSSKVDAALEMRFVKNQLIRPGDTVIECGAHHGAQTILLSRWAGNQGKVIALEPIPENFEILKKNVELNKLENVVLVNKAVGNSCGSISMKLRSNGAVSAQRGAKNTIEIESITLDKLTADLGVTPTFVKIDVEGYEYQILEGGKATLSARPAVFVEVHTLSLPQYEKKFEDIWQSIDANHYHIFIQSDDFKDPVPYVPGTMVNTRVHLFFKPR